MDITGKEITITDPSGNIGNYSQTGYVLTDVSGNRIQSTTNGLIIRDNQNIGTYSKNNVSLLDGSNKGVNITTNGMNITGNTENVTYGLTGASFTSISSNNPTSSINASQLTFTRSSLSSGYGQVGFNLNDTNGTLTATGTNLTFNDNSKSWIYDINGFRSEIKDTNGFISGTQNQITATTSQISFFDQTNGGIYGKNGSVVNDALENNLTTNSTSLTISDTLTFLKVDKNGITSSLGTGTTNLPGIGVGTFNPVTGTPINSNYNILNNNNGNITIGSNNIGNDTPTRTTIDGIFDLSSSTVNINSLNLSSKDTNTDEYALGYITTTLTPITVSSSTTTLIPIDATRVLTDSFCKVLGKIYVPDDIYGVYLVTLGIRAQSTATVDYLTVGFTESSTETNTSTPDFDFSTTLVALSQTNGGFTQLTRTFLFTATKKLYISAQRLASSSDITIKSIKYRLTRIG